MQQKPIAAGMADLFFRAGLAKEAKRYTRTVFAEAARRDIVMHDKPKVMVIGVMAALLAVHEHCPLSLAKLTAMSDEHAASAINALLERISSAGVPKEGYKPEFAA